MPDMQTLIKVLHLLAAPVEEQVRAFPAFVVVADEIALLFDDEMTRLKSALDVLPPEVRTILGAIDARLEAMGDEEYWTLQALTVSEEWNAVRNHARAALEAMGEALEPPRLDWVTYTRG